MKNKILKIGKISPTVKIDQLDDYNNIVTSWDIYKVNRRKNKLICAFWGGEIILTFLSLKLAEKCKKEMIKSMKINKEIYV